MRSGGRALLAGKEYVSIETEEEYVCIETEEEYVSIETEGFSFKTVANKLMR